MAAPARAGEQTAIPIGRSASRAEVWHRSLGDRGVRGMTLGVGRQLRGRGDTNADAAASAVTSCEVERRYYRGEARAEVASSSDGLRSSVTRTVSASRLRPVRRSPPRCSRRAGDPTSGSVVTDARGVIADCIWRIGARRRFLDMDGNVESCQRPVEARHGHRARPAASVLSARSDRDWCSNGDRPTAQPAAGRRPSRGRGAIAATIHVGTR